MPFFTNLNNPDLGLVPMNQSANYAAGYLSDGQMWIREGSIVKFMKKNETFDLKMFQYYDPTVVPFEKGTDCICGGQEVPMSKEDPAVSGFVFGASEDQQKAFVNTTAFIAEASFDPIPFKPDWFCDVSKDVNGGVTLEVPMTRSTFLEVSTKLPLGLITKYPELIAKAKQEFEALIDSGIEKGCDCISCKPLSVDVSAYHDVGTKCSHEHVNMSSDASSIFQWDKSTHEEFVTAKMLKSFGHLKFKFPPHFIDVGQPNNPNNPCTPIGKDIIVIVRKLSDYKDPNYRYIDHSYPLNGRVKWSIDKLNGARKGRYDKLIGDPLQYGLETWGIARFKKYYVCGCRDGYLDDIHPYYIKRRAEVRDTCVGEVK